MAAIPRHEGDAAAQAAADARRAANELAEADDALTLAQARLQEAIDAAPRVSPRVAAAAGQVRAAEESLDQAVEAQLEADRKAEDCRGGVLVAQAMVEDLAGFSTVTEAQQVRAEQGLAQAQRAVVSAERGLARRTAARQHAGDVLAGAEQGLEEARDQPRSDSSAVLKARMDVGRAERSQRSSQERAAATKRSYEQVVHNTDGGGAALPVRKYYGSLDEFVVEYVLRNWRRRDGDTTSHWCARWWKHAEAGTRLGHLWEAFEVLRREQAPGMSTLWRDHIDYHMRVLTDPQGPFERCNQTHHEALPMWASAPPPQEMFRYDAACEFEDVVRQRREIEQEAAAEAARVSGAVDQADQSEGVRA